MSQRTDAVRAYRNALSIGGAAEFRLPMSTDDALALAADVADETLKHKNQVRASALVIEKLREHGEPESFEQRLAYYKSLDDAAKVFWDAFEGQEVEGVTIVRKR